MIRGLFFGGYSGLAAKRRKIAAWVSFQKKQALKGRKKTLVPPKFFRPFRAPYFQLYAEQQQSSAATRPILLRRFLGGQMRQRRILS
jgi:hypothetical protein